MVSEHALVSRRTPAGAQEAFRTFKCSSEATSIGGGPISALLLRLYNVGNHGRFGRRFAL
jgi:hypothetical protein